jgi:cytochrome P450
MSSTEIAERRRDEAKAAPRFDLDKVNLNSREVRANPYPLYAQLRAGRPVCRARAAVVPGIREAWLITRYDDVASMLKDERFSKNKDHSAKKIAIPDYTRPLLQGMLDMDDPDHARLRSLVHKGFTPGIVDRLQGRIQEISNQLIDEVESRGAMDLVESFALILPITVILELLGIPTSERNRFGRWSRKLLVEPTLYNMLAGLPALLGFTRYLKRLVKELRSKPQSGLLSALVQIEDAGDRLSNDELVGMAFLLIVAGYETTVNLIANGMLALMQNPEQLQRLRENPALMKTAIEEFLRYSSPLELATPRYASEDLTVAGTTIPRGAMVLAVLASANRDESQFDEPDTLDIARENNRHLAFGLGVHFCLGAPLARLEAQIAIGTLLRRLPELRLAVPAERLNWRTNPILHGLEALPVKF